MAKSYGVTTDIIPAKGGMGPGGVDKMPSARMGRLDAADRMAEARKIAKEADKKSGIKPYSPPTRGSKDSDTGKRTNPEKMGSGTYMKRKAEDSDNAFTTSKMADAIERGDLDFKKGGSVKSSASKRADGCCVRGKTKA